MNNPNTFFQPLQKRKAQGLGTKQTCIKCGLYQNVLSPRMEAFGNFRKGILNIGEAPGGEEDRKGKQWQGKVGRRLKRMYGKLGIDLFDDCLNINAVNCFIRPEVKVYTSDGYKCIKNVKIGDLVLTHKGRFRKVLSRTHDLPDKVRTNKEILIKIKPNRGPSFTVTAQHQFKTQAGWKSAITLNSTDCIQVLGERCIVCGKVYFKKPYTFDSAESTCSKRCHNIYSVQGSSREKIRKSMLKQYKQGIRNKNTITQSANEETRKRVKEGTWHINKMHDEKAIGKANKIRALNRQSFNSLYKGIIVGEGEHIFAEYLITQKINFYHQYALDEINYDFFLPNYNLLIEIENPRSYWYNKGAKERNYANRSEKARKNGLEILYLSSKDPIQKFERIIRNHDKEYLFTYTNIESIELIESKACKLFCLEVEEDHSFVAAGVVHHNCRPMDKNGKNRAPTDTEIVCCRRKIMQLIEQYQPRVIVLLGNAAITSLIGHRWKKNLGGISKWRGWTIPDRDMNAWVCPIFHPSYVERNSNMPMVETIWEQDVEKALGMADKSLPELVDDRKNIEFVESQEDLQHILQKISMGQEGGLTFFDYETTGLKPHAKGHRIICCSIATGPHKAYSFMMPTKKWERAYFNRFLASNEVYKGAANMKFEEMWSQVRLGYSVRNWYFDIMQAAHILDNRPEITSVKFQTYVHLGVIDYDSHIEPYLKARDPKNGNSFNRIYNAIDKFGERELLTYCGLDSLYEYQIGMMQMNELGFDPNPNGSIQV